MAETAVSGTSQEPSSLDAVLDGAARLQALDDWSTARLAAGKLILGELGGIETGVRQMVRRRPLEVEEVPLGNRVLRVPTLEEILRTGVAPTQSDDHLLPQRRG
jgi:hypothetical protein